MLNIVYDTCSSILPAVPLLNIHSSKLSINWNDVYKGYLLMEYSFIKLDKRYIGYTLNYSYICVAILVATKLNLTENIIILKSLFE